MKSKYISCVVAAALGVSLQVQADHNPGFVLTMPQTTLWYSNNFGASAEQHFPELKPESFSTGSGARSGWEKNSFGMRMDDVDFMFGGRVRQEGQLFDRPLTLRDDYADMYGFVRSKLNLDFTTQYGRRSFGKPAAQMHMRLTAFSIWDDPYLYTPVLSEKVYFHGTNFLKKAEIDEHTHRGVVPLMFLEEGWVKVNFDAFLKNIQYPLSLQVGSFPFIVGRGITLGDYFEAGEEYLGFERKGDIGNAPQKPMGLLLSVGVGETGVFEFYYSKWRKRSHGPDWTREEVKAKRLDRDEMGDPRAIERGQNNDTDIFAARLGYNLSVGNQSIYLEPYAVFLNAPELRVEFDADSALRQGTAGFMAEFTRGNLSVNFEAAVQYGRQHMFPIDRNHLVIDDAYYTQAATHYTGQTPSNSAVSGRLDKQIGQPVKYHSHVVLGIATPGTAAEEYLPYHAYYVSDEMMHINADRSVAQQGGVIRKGPPKTSSDTYIAGDAYKSYKHTPGNGFDASERSMYSQYQFKSGIKYYDDLDFVSSVPTGSLYNVNLPFGAQRRFRDAYTVTNIGVMGMLDARYTLPEKRMNVSCALGFVGGDEYPLQPSEKDRESSHFMPLRDSNYVGRYVTSFVMLYPRKFPRPQEMSDNDLYSFNHYKTMQNLQYVGVGSQWYPLASGTVMLEANAIYFWEVQPPHKWNVNQDRVFPNNSKPGKEDSIYKYIQSKELHFSGSASDEWASNQLGLELNVVVSWRPYKSLQFDFRSGIFLPGQLYDDVKGCPNINTRRLDERGEWHYDSLGSQLVSGAQIRLTYKF